MIQEMHPEPHRLSSIPAGVPYMFMFFSSAVFGWILKHNNLSESRIACPTKFSKIRMKHFCEYLTTQLQEEMVAPLENLRTTAQVLLSDGELAKKWQDMNTEERPKNQ